MEFNESEKRSLDIEMNEWTPKKPASAVPLNALRAFEATARYMSIKNAAKELNVTPSAVSHRLRQLEKTLGLPLLRRSGSHIELTEHGMKLAPALSGGFAMINEALGSLQSEHHPSSP